MEDEIHHHFRAAISAIHVSTCSVRRQTSRKASHAGKRRQYKAFGGVIIRTETCCGKQQNKLQPKRLKKKEAQYGIFQQRNRTVWLIC